MAKETAPASPPPAQQQQAAQEDGGDVAVAMLEQPKFKRVAYGSPARTYAEAMERNMLAGLAREQHKERMREWLQLSCPERTQRQAEARWGHEKHFPLWTVSVPKDKSQPTVTLRAYDAAGARGRYCELCGITSTEEPVQAVRAE